MRSRIRSVCLHAIRTSYRASRSLYRQARSLRSHLANAFDRPVIILLYHRVTELNQDPQMISVTPAHFYQQIKFLKTHFEILRLEEDWGSGAKRGVVITFDDGYVDNISEALPVLDACRVPATFFVSTGHLGTRKAFWWDRLEHLLLREGDFRPFFELKDPRLGRVMPTGTSKQREKAYSVLTSLMKKVDAERRDSWLAQLKDWAGPGEEVGVANRTMTAEEVKRLAESPWATIGAHTVTHSALSALTEEEQRKEIFDSKQRLEVATGKPVQIFSYPFGRRRDYNQISVRLCREAGFRKATSNFPGQVHRWTDPFQLPRHLVRDWPIERFETELRGFWTR